MNKQNILALADDIENEVQHIPGQTFDMNWGLLRRGSEYFTCIAGYCYTKTRTFSTVQRRMRESTFRDEVKWSLVEKVALDYLGITPEQGNGLLKSFLFEVRGNHLWAARTLRHFAYTGEIDWIKTSAPKEGLRSFTKTEKNTFKLAEFLRDLPSERFDMTSGWYDPSFDIDPRVNSSVRPASEGPSCGSAGCIAGWAYVNNKSYSQVNPSFSFGSIEWEYLEDFASKYLGLKTTYEMGKMFLAEDVGLSEVGDDNKWASRVLFHYLHTGEIDWRITREGGQD